MRVESFLTSGNFCYIVLTIWVIFLIEMWPKRVGRFYSDIFKLSNLVNKCFLIKKVSNCCRPWSCHHQLQKLIFFSFTFCGIRVHLMKFIIITTSSSSLFCCLSLRAHHRPLTNVHAFLIPRLHHGKKNQTNGSQTNLREYTQQFVNTCCGSKVWNSLCDVWFATRRYHNMAER